MHLENKKLFKVGHASGGCHRKGAACLLEGGSRASVLCTDRLHYWFVQHHFCASTLKKDVRRAHVAFYHYIPAKVETESLSSNTFIQTAEPSNPTTMVLYSTALQVTPNNFCASFWLEHVMCSVWCHGSSMSLYYLGFWVPSVSQLKFQCPTGQCPTFPKAGVC